MKNLYIVFFMISATYLIMGGVIITQTENPHIIQIGYFLIGLSVGLGVCGLVVPHKKTDWKN